MIRGVRLLVEGRKKPLHITTRKRKGSIVGAVVDDAKTLFTFSISENNVPVIVITSDKVVVVDETTN